MGVASQFYTPVCDNKVPSLVASLFSWRCLAASTSSFLHAAINLRPPSVTLSTHTSAFKASLSSPPLCQTSGCRSVRNRSTLFPSHPVPSVLHPQGFRKRFASAAARRSFAGASPPTKVFSFATSSQCFHTRLSQGHGCTKSSDGLVSCAVPRWYEARLGGVRCGVWRSVPGEGSTYCIHTRGPRLPPP